MARDIPSWASSVSAKALADLLAVQGERDWLDYKTQCDLKSARGIVELAKEECLKPVDVPGRGCTFPDHP